MNAERHPRRAESWQCMVLAVVALLSCGSVCGTPPFFFRDYALILVPTGRFQPFFREDARERAVLVEPYLLDAAPVTRGEFLEFVTRYPQWRRSNTERLFAESNYLVDWRDDLEPGTETLDRPVTFVSWFAARAYCASQDKTLPTVAQWERAAGEGEHPAARTHASTFRFAMGTPASDLVRAPLVVGGVWEWNADFNSAIVTSSAFNDGNPLDAYCGAGARAKNARDYGAFLRYALRSSLKASYALRDLGFRCARSAP